MYQKRIKFVRERIGLTKREVANQLNINESHYNHLESETEIIPLKHLVNLCNILNISLDYAFELTEEKQYKKVNKELNMIKVGERLKEFRKSEKLTQEKLAEKLNVAKSIISKYEKGEFLISTHALYTICEKYKISADYLLGRIDSPKNLK